MGEKKDKVLSERELKLYHEFFADSIIDPNLYSPKTHYLDRNDSEVTASTIRKEESKFRRSLKNRADIPTEIWMG
jgi:hypothetical protein